MSENKAQFYVGQKVWDRTLSEESGVVIAKELGFRIVYLK